MMRSRQKLLFLLFIFSTAWAEQKPQTAPTQQANSPFTTQVPPPFARTADLILKNGRIFADNDGTQTWLQALSIRDGNLFFIGSSKNIEKDKGPITKVIDLTGKLVLPGFVDCSARLDLSSKSAFLRTQEDALKLGVTSVEGEPITSKEEVQVIQELYQSKQLKIRLSLLGDLEAPEKFLQIREQFKSIPEEWVKFHGLHGAIDGEFENYEASLSLPYSDKPEVVGKTLYTQERLNDLVISANRYGLPVVLKATGDHAVNMAFTAFATAKKQLFNSRVRNRIEGAELVPPKLYARIADYNIVVCATPNRIVFEKESDNTLEKKLGKERTRAYASWKSFITHGAHVSFGSDWPTRQLNPLLGIYGAVYRSNLDGKTSRNTATVERMSIEKAVESYTIGGAYGTTEEHVKGSLREGKYADVVIFSQDIFKTRAKSLVSTPVYMTIVAGQIVYDGSLPRIQQQPN